MDTDKITQLGKNYVKILTNSIYGSPGSDSGWLTYYKQYKKTQKIKQKIKKLYSI